MKYEIEFLAVGNGEKSGDAILVRYEENSGYKIMIIDGGSKDSGEAIVNHIKTHYSTDYVDYVVNTHPDQDHASGLSVVLEKLEVGELWIHRPWNYTKQIIDFFHDGRMTEQSLKERLQQSFSYVYPLEEIAKKKNIPIYEPYEGRYIGVFEVLSPKKNWYLYDLIPNFNKTPQAKSSVGLALKSMKEAILNWISEEMHIETLSENGTTSADNESSTILYGNLGGKGILFTGDAGTLALNKAYQYKPSISENLTFIQVPHHGSRNNVSPSILDNLLGKRIQEVNKTAFISASKNSTTHPRQSVVNAFIRRGCQVATTNGQGYIRYFSEILPRPGETDIVCLEFKKRFQE